MLLNFCSDVESLKEENRRLKDTMLCKICMDKDISTLFLPCSHLVCCDTCAPTVHDCPICRTAIRGTVRTYISWTLCINYAGEHVRLFATMMLFIVVRMSDAWCFCSRALLKQAGTRGNCNDSASWFYHMLLFCCLFHISSICFTHCSNSAH